VFGQASRPDRKFRVVSEHFRTYRPLSLTAISSHGATDPWHTPGKPRPDDRIDNHGVGLLRLSLDEPADPETNVVVDPYESARPVINAVLTPYTLAKHLSIPVHVNKAERPHLALLDSGAMGNFIHEHLVQELGLTCIPWCPLPLMDVKGLKIGSLSFQVKVDIRIGSHEEQIILDVAPIGSHRLILGLPWLEAHDPTIQWSTGHIQFNSQHCNMHCLPQPHDIFAKQSVAVNHMDIRRPAAVTKSTPDMPMPTCRTKDSAPCEEAIQTCQMSCGEPSLESVEIESMEPELVEVFAIDLMPTAMEETLKELIPGNYHGILEIFDPEGPLKRLPPLRPGYDFEIPLDTTKLLPKSAWPYHMNPSEREDWIKWKMACLRQD
jgi:hypothetical protein